MTNLRKDDRGNILKFPVIYLVPCEIFFNGQIFSPGLVVMGGDSCPKVRWFESQCCLLDGHFSHIPICC